MSTAPPTAEPLLRTLAPALRRLDERLRPWLAAPHRWPMSALTQAMLDGLSADLQRQAAALDVDRPLLIIVFMGGTGVGKSTLLNALARSNVAQASFARPTTRDPVVYYHQSVHPERLDPALKQCRLVAHDRPGLEQKILVDTPDLDSNELANREKLKQLLRVADIVLYVGSQEKYHDKLGWELFLEQRKRRAFAFVLNKWDRCLHGGNSGVRPDEDLLHDLREEGFGNPLLFRTCAQAWVDQRTGSASSLVDGTANEREGYSPPSPALPEGEQFQALEHWLELGLTRLEIEAIKARGVGQLLEQLQQALEAAKPPDLSRAAASTRKGWEQSLDEEAHTMADLLLITTDPYQREIEQHFAMQGHRRFRGPMATFLHVVTRLRFLGTTLRQRVPRPLRGDLTEPATATAWDMAAFAKACTSLASERHLDARSRALPNHLLVLADKEGFPVSLLSEPVEAAARSDWRQRFATTLLEVLREVESQWVQPTGPRRWVERILIWLGDLGPWTALVATFAFLIYAWFSGLKSFGTWDLFMPFGVMLVSMILLYVLVTLLLPLRWPAIRNTFQRELSARLRDELAAVYLPIPNDLWHALGAERRKVEQLIGECREVAGWLKDREDAATIEVLYGKQPASAGRT